MVNGAGGDSEADESDEGGSLNEKVHSQFDHLLESLEERRSDREKQCEDESESNVQTPSVTDRPTEGSVSNETDDRARGTEPSESLLRARRLPSEQGSAASRSSDSMSFNIESIGKKKFYVGLVVGIILATLLPGFVIASSAHITDTILAPEPTSYLQPDDILYIEADDAAYLTRIFEETTHEVAYCGLITHDEETPTLEIWMANTLNAAPDQIEFVTENCPGSVQEVLLHTHPNGSLQLSEQDRQTLEQRPEEIMCVQGGPLETEPGADVDQLDCYRQLQPEQDGLSLSEVPIVVSKDSSFTE